jgi:class 3 adenylate cyclase
MELGASCRQCGAQASEGARYCSACGSSILPAAIEAERRQLTVLFCDMVDSTALSSSLDPEDFGDVLNSFQRVCRDAIVRYGGHVSQFLGDGVLAYFGYPIAHEDDAVRAIRAALSILDTVKLVNQGIGRRLHTEIRVRSGLHTGIAVIGAGLGSQDRLAVGETVNLAARIETFAPIDSVVVSASTAELVSGHFELESLNAQQLKGFAKSVELFRVMRPTRARTHFEAAARRTLTPHVNRTRELARLSAVWQRVRDGSTGAILLKGEAGIGKSRLMYEFRQAVLDDGVSVLECFCSPLMQATALSPIIELLHERIDATHTHPDKLQALHEMLAEHSRFGADALPLMAALLSIPGADETPVRELSPLRRRARTLELLRDWLASSSERVPVALLLEDVHWADPSTLDLLDLLIREGPGARALLCMTSRPELARGWDPERVQVIELHRFEASEIHAVVSSVHGPRSLPASVVMRIAERSEGVPLYIEEITKLVLDRLPPENDVADAAWSGQLLPSTVRGTLEARLDQVGRGRKTAQLGAAIGREFGYAIIRAVAGIEEPELREHLAALRKSELALVEGEPPDSTYRFKHALIQDAIYDTIPKNLRETFHERIFVTLQRDFAELLKARPEVGAHHAERAGRIQVAVELLRDAGLDALSRNAIVEAVHHLQHALDLLRAIEEPARSSLELELRAAIGPAFMAIRGWASVEVEQSSARLLELATALGDSQRSYLARWALWTVHFVRGELRAAMAVAARVYAIANEAGDPLLRITGCHAYGYTAYFRAELELAKSIAHEALALSTLERERQLAAMNQLSSGSIIWGFCSAAHWLLGEQDQAEALLAGCHRLLEGLHHAPSTVLSLAMEGYVLHMQREPKKLGALALRLRSVSEQEGYALWISMSYVFEAWSLAHAGEIEPATKLMDDAIAAYRATNSELTMCDNTVMQVEVLLLAGRTDAALRAIADGKQICERLGERTLEPELYRLEGEARHALGDEPAALAATRSALQRARELKALSLELRAATQLYQWAPSRDTRELLRAVYSQFHESFHQPDLRVAKSCLDAESNADG